MFLSTLTPLCVSQQEYSKLNYLDVIVKASLRVNGAAKNMVLRNAETQVLDQFHISNTN